MEYIKLAESGERPLPIHGEDVTRSTHQTDAVIDHILIVSLVTTRFKAIMIGTTRVLGTIGFPSYLSPFVRNASHQLQSRIIMTYGGPASYISPSFPISWARSSFAALLIPHSSYSYRCTLPFRVPLTIVQCAAMLHLWSLGLMRPAKGLIMVRMLYISLRFDDTDLLICEQSRSLSKASTRISSPTIHPAKSWTSG